MKLSKRLIKYIREEHEINQRLADVGGYIEKAKDEGRPGLLEHLRTVRDTLNNRKYELDERYPEYAGICLTEKQYNLIINFTKD